jgi:hypothetical protein
MGKPKKALTTDERKASKKQSAEKWRRDNAEKIKKRKRDSYAVNKDAILAQQREHHRLLRLGLKKKGPPRKKREGGTIVEQRKIRRENNTISKAKTRQAEKLARKQKIIDAFNEAHNSKE